MNYYDEKNHEAWAVIGITIKSLLLLIVVLWLMHACVAAIEKQTDPTGELNKRNRAEIMQRTGYEEAMHIEYADRVLTARVERDWREKK